MPWSMVTRTSNSDHPNSCTVRHSCPEEAFQCARQALVERVAAFEIIQQVLEWHVLAAKHASLRVGTRHAGVRAPRYRDRKSTRLNSSHLGISYAVFCL